jgi:hypothetical protein
MEKKCPLGLERCPTDDWLRLFLLKDLSDGSRAEQEIERCRKSCLKIKDRIGEMVRLLTKNKGW